MTLRFLLLVLFDISYSDVYVLNKQEAAHAGLSYTYPQITKEFSKSKYSGSAELTRNDYAAHHVIVRDFCHSRKSSCSWKEYYDLLDHIREPYAKLFDPGQEPVGTPITKIQEIAKSGYLYQESCEVIDKPSPSTFYKYIAGSKPVVIRGLSPRLQPSDWSLKSLLDLVGDVQVVASASPTGEFDAPEDPSLWGIHENRGSQIDLIVRPAHLNMLFSEFISMLTRKDLNNSNFYLEYFPMFAAFNLCTQGLRACEHLMDQLPDYKFANFLGERYHLLWMGGGSRRLSKEDTDYPNSRLHYDRMENLMTVLTGKKTFHLYDPSQSDNLHGGSEVLSASFSASVTRQSCERSHGRVKRACVASGIDGNLVDVQFTRDPSTVVKDTNAYHTYSPVNIKKPNITRYPKFVRAKGMACTLSAGDTLYVPSHWWHEVVSEPDEEGKSIGSNIFFEPFYNRPGYLTVTETLQKNRFYAHMQDLNFAKPCSKSKVCWTHTNASETSENRTSTEVDEAAIANHASKESFGGKRTHVKVKAKVKAKKGKVKAKAMLKEGTVSKIKPRARPKNAKDKLTNSERRRTKFREEF